MVLLVNTLYFLIYTDSFVCFFYAIKLEENMKGEIVELDVKDIKDFPNHPFKINNAS